ncbi:hypothetical protein GCE86_08725 [Micromonospora terminaliae]|uniref:Uncharacterized protein n=1 Tax=Micromonospora terminaliae TaxID=1914461 RepID=A0AAJ3DIS7_9ACTN|nr:DUF6361 family protein [Micromonospora terminaliae]NES28129.1 hypothetical protein [Micromonospora terminaliae]QGL47126.1 hypothetical protein GCE86_08725 [Micromonospora terminaliae]
MASGLSWLDSSREDQQRLRELLKLFSDTESRDELGIGQVRDAFSDLLFPGTSVIQTRARYLLIVPWCFQEAQRRGLRGDRFAAQVDRNERKVIDALLRGDDTEGVIGRRAGVGVRTLPSSIYAAALLRYGIRTGADDSAPGGRLASGLVEADELTERSGGMWHRTLPSAPASFPAEVEGGLRLSPEEARWLRERLLAAAPSTLLAYLLQPENCPGWDSTAPWDEPAALVAPEPIGSLVRDAVRFSLAIHGAALLYNLLVAERYQVAGLTEHEEPVDWYRNELKGWDDRVSAERGLKGWDRSGMWDRLIEQNPRIAGNVAGRRFIDRWLEAVTSGAAGGAADDQSLRNLVAERERSVKKGQSRLVNEKLLRTWSGASGSRQLVFRWPQVRRILIDVHDGCAADLPEAAGARA